MKALQERLNVRLIYYYYSSSSVFHTSFRARSSVGRSASPAMHGRHPTRTGTSLSLGIGLKNEHRESGNSSTLSSGSRS